MNPHFEVRERCPVCDSSEHRELYRCAFTDPPIRDFLAAGYGGNIDFSFLEGASYVLLECRDCGLIFQREAPGDRLSEILYDEWVSPEASLHKKEKNAALVRGRIALEVMLVLEYIGRRPEDVRVLDFGMGWGDWCRVARAFGCDVAGVETSSSRVRHAERLGITVLSPDRLPAAAFDFINTDQVFEHLTDPLGAASLLADALSPGGILKIAVPNGRRVKRRLRTGDWRAAKGSRRSLHDVSPLQHVNCFQYRSLVRLAARVGLEPVRIPARMRYRYAPMWERPRSLAKRTVGQHVRAVLRQSTVVWFRKPGRPTAEALAAPAAEVEPVGRGERGVVAAERLREPRTDRG